MDNINVFRDTVFKFLDNDKDTKYIMLKLKAKYPTINHEILNKYYKECKKVWMKPNFPVSQTFISETYHPKIKKVSPLEFEDRAETFLGEKIPETKRPRAKKKRLRIW